MEIKAGAIEAVIHEALTRYTSAKPKLTVAPLVGNNMPILIIEKKLIFGCVQTVGLKYLRNL